MNYYADIHANILPDMDFAGGSVLRGERQKSRVTAMRESNIKQAIAAPLYDPEKWTPREFLDARDEKFERIERETPSMRLVRGAAVRYDFCVAHAKELSDFALGGTGYFLVDLPDTPVTRQICEDLHKTHIVSRLCPIVADADRFYDIWAPEQWPWLRESGILAQISIDGILRPERRDFSLFLLANQFAQFIATGGRDTGEDLRFSDAMRIVQRSLPAQVYKRVKNNSGMLLSNASPSEFLAK